MSFKIHVHELKNFSTKEREFALRAIEKAERIINSKEFKERAEKLELVFTKGKFSATADEVYKEFISGKDKFNKEEDGDIDLFLTAYYSWKRTIGYTYPSTWKTWANRRFFKDEADFAGNIVHEYMHNLGYDHSSPKEHKSVPYAYGYLVRDMIKEYAG